MKSNKNKVVKYIVLFGIFLLGILSGLFLWDKIVFPFKNPWNVVGPLTLLKYNPINDFVRFSVFILLPSLMLFSFIIFKRERLNRILFDSEINSTSLWQKEHSEFFSTKKWIIFISLLIAFSFVLALSNHAIVATRGLDTFHEGETLGTAVSYMNGQAPYRDFLFLHGVFQDPLRSVLAFKLFGRSIGAVRTLDSIIKIITFILFSLFLLKIFRKNPLFSLATLAILYCLFVLMDAGYDITNLRFNSIIHTREIMTFSFLIVVAFLQDYLHIKSGAKERKTLFLFLVFFFSFIPLASFGYSVDKGFFLLAAYFVLSPLLYFFFFRRSVYGASYLIFSLIGLAAAFFLLLFLMRGGFYEFLRFNSFIMPRYKELMDGIVYPIHLPLYLAPCILIAANTYWIVFKLMEEFHLNNRKVRASIQSFLEKYLVEFCLLLLSIFFFRAALGRSDLGHLVVNSFIIYILSVIILVRHYLQHYIIKGGYHKLFLYGTGFLVLFLLIVSFYRIYDKKLIVKNFPLHREDSEFIPEKYIPVITFLKENLNEGEEFFTMTSEAIWYYFLDKPCPSRFPVVWFAIPDFYQKEIVENLKSKNVKFILYYNNNYSSKFDNIDNEMRLPILVDFIIENYVFYKKINEHEIWIRESEVKNINEEMLAKKGVVLARRKRFEEAIASLREAVRINNDYEEGHMHLGSVLFSLKYLLEAKHHFQEVLRINPYADMAHVNLGVIFFDLKDIQGAVFHFQQALRINPDNKQALKNLEKIQKMIGKYH